MLLQPFIRRFCMCGKSVCLTKLTYLLKRSVNGIAKNQSCVPSVWTTLCVRYFCRERGGGWRGAKLCCRLH